MHHSTNRRDFIRNVGILVGGSAILPEIGCHPTSAIKGLGNHHFDTFGIQLYTLRDLVPHDIMSVVRSLSTFGYKQIEGYEDDQGLWWGFSPQEFKKRITDVGIKMVSSHCKYTENLDQKAEQAAFVGLEYLICPWVGPQKTMDDWKRITDTFNEAGRICKKHGIRFAYHNHEYTFKAFSGMIPHDFLMANTDPDTVDHDIYWVVTGGADPEAFLTKYKNRFRLCHVKDRMSGTDEKEASCDLGTGMINYPKILRTALDNGMKHFIVEQERYDGSTSIKSAEANANYLKRLMV
jgi:sugar phosphate isomerase/epimerase